MKWKILSVAVGTLVLVGCATSDRDYHRADRYNDRRGEVYVNRDGDRIHVRESDRDYRGSPTYQNNMEPRVRGKHADALGWNNESYYLQRGYKR